MEKENCEYHVLGDDVYTRETMMSNRKILESMEDLELLILYFLTFGTGSYSGLDYDQLIEKINGLSLDERLTKRTIKNCINKLFGVKSERSFYLNFGTFYGEYVSISIYEPDQIRLKRLVQSRLGYLPDVWKHRRWSKERKQRHSEIMKTSWKKRKQ